MYPQIKVAGRLTLAQTERGALLDLGPTAERFEREQHRHFTVTALVLIARGFVFQRLQRRLEHRQ